MLIRKDCRELIAMAELGYVEGIDKVIDRIETTGKSDDFVSIVRSYKQTYQFSEIIAMSKQVIS